MRTPPCNYCGHCKLCHRIKTDVRYRRLFAGQLAQPCGLRGEELRQVVCTLCGQRGKMLPVYACPLHGECTNNKVGKYKSCLTCADRLGNDPSAVGVERVTGSLEAVVPPLVVGVETNDSANDGGSEEDADRPLDDGCDP